MKEKKDIAERYLVGQASESEQQELLDWMQRDVDLDLWFRTNLELTENNIPEEVRHRVLNGILLDGESAQESKICREGTRLSLWGRIAAVCVVLIMSMGVGVGGFFLGKGTSSYATNALEVRTDVGERSRVTLPDGTEVVTNAVSKLRYEQTTSGERSVYLDGEAFFEVAKDAEHPFVVHTSDMSVTCLGTRFDVRSYADEQQSQVVLSDGKVRVNSRDAEITMEPNTKVTLDKESLAMTKQSVSSELYTCWTSGEIRYNDQTLEEIAAELSRNYHVQMVITSDKLRKERFTGYLGHCSLRNVLDLLSLTSNINYYVDNDTVVYVYAKN